MKTEKQIAEHFQNMLNCVSSLGLRFVVEHDISLEKTNESLFVTIHELMERICVSKDVLEDKTVYTFFDGSAYKDEN